MYLKVGRPADAESAYQEARKIQSVLVRDHPAVAEYQVDLARTQLSLAKLYRSQLANRTRPAQEAFREALALCEALVRDHPAIADYQARRASTYASAGNFYLAANRLEEAEKLLGKAVEFGRLLARDHAQDPDNQADLAGSHFDLGKLYQRTGRPKEAEQAFQAGLAIFQKLVRDYPNEPRYRAILAETHNILAGLYRSNFQGRAPDAERAHQEALALREALVRDFPGVPNYVLDLGATQSNLGNLMRLTGRPEAAHTWYTRAVATLDPLLARDRSQVVAHGVLRDAHWGRALVLAGLGRHAESVTDWDRAIDLDPGPKRAQFRLQRAIALAHAGEYAKSAAEANALADADNVTGEALYDAACVFALSAGAVRTDAAQAENYAARAVALLRRAVDKGYKDINHMRKDTDLDPLRKRADFQKLLAETEAKGK
jgi:tetratricopeptide (TPR) repeat protein